MRIEILGWYHGNGGVGGRIRGNAGDESFRAIHRHIFRKHNLSYIKPPATCTTPDMIVLGGGAVIAPYYLNCLGKSNCPKYALGVSVSYESEMDLIPNTFKHIYLRDEYDIASMRQKVSCPVDLTPDLAFFYRPRGEDVMRRYTSSSKRMSLGVMLTDYINPAIDRPQADFTAKAESFKIKLAKELDKLARHGWDIYLIPLSTTGYGNDIRINLDVASFMQERPIIIYETLSPQECIDLVAQMDLTVCMKFHAYIFSMIAGVPFVSLGLTRKVDLFLGAHDLKKFTAAKFDETGTQFNTSKFAEVVDDVLTHKQTLSNKFIDISDRHYRRLHELSDKIRRDWLGEQ